PGSDQKVTTETVLNLLSRAFLSCAWGSIGIATNETYPTVIRGLGFGASNVSARVGAMLAPFLLNFEEGPTLALATVGGSLLLAALAVCFLQETSGKALKEFIADVGKTADKQRENESPQANVYVTKNDANTNDVVGDGGGAACKNESSRL
ncbi:unnamed protein product, partial [Candidula unifasciata]